MTEDTVIEGSGNVFRYIGLLYEAEAFDILKLVDPFPDAPDIKAAAAIIRQTIQKSADEIERLERERDSARADLKKISKIIDERDDLYDMEEDIKAVLEGRSES